MQESGMLIELAVGFTGGLCGGLAFHAALARKVYNLQLDLSMLQAQLLRERNQRASLSRSKDKEALEVLQDLKSTPPPAAKVNHLAKFGIGR